MTKLKTSKLRTYAFSLFLLISSLFLTPNYFYASDSIAISLDKLLLFESGKDVPQKLNRKYINCFEPEARFINIELNVKNQKYTIADQDYKITFIWRYLNGAEFGKDEATFHIKSDWQTAYINRSWGWPEKGKWPLGRFTAQVFVNGTLFAEKDYFINFSGKDYISFPEINKPIENIPSLNEGIICQTLHQYKIDPYFNSYYPIEFSNDGKDIAYCLSQFERTSGYKTTTVTRNVFLFKNNKQILPVYFRIDPFFDKKLENLAYLGVQTTGGTFNDIYAYYNGNQLLKSILMPAFYISPDCKKYTYVLNTMNRIKSSFTWDDAYEFVMINQQKVQAEYLANAKSINIKEPVIYIKNEDNSYNAIYSAKYKVNKQVSHALFNQAERISPEFDGYISKPYLSADNKKVAYIVQDKKEWFIMINDKRITKGYKEIK
ncbi:MAG: hypothetical protein P1P88_24960, partial [Bacteroidales bacterium]|nr:hypothetical protein [Bacteroidales bacterium]